LRSRIAGASSSDAVAMKTTLAIPILNRRMAVRHENGGLQNHPYLGDMPNGEHCWHSATVPLDRLPDWDWYDTCAHLKCHAVRQHWLG
jgi:hypothetical protein